MAIIESESYIYLNYFSALDSDLRLISRYIEFTEENFNTYSIELAHLLLSSSSEIDVILKELCKLLNPEKYKNIKIKKESKKQNININDCRKIIKDELPEFCTELVYLTRFSLKLNPWKNWASSNKNPNWWQEYNLVKHERTNNFNKANLKNVLNSLAALLVTLIYYYKYKFNYKKLGDVTYKLNLCNSDNFLMKLHPDCYSATLLSSSER